MLRCAQLTAGSDLHAYRGLEPGGPMGHEVCGEIVAAGPEVKKFKVGDRVLCPFSNSCGACYFCERGWTSRCKDNYCLSGGQAEYFLVHEADADLYPLPSDLPEEMALLLTDILPTGYSAAFNARRLMDDGWLTAEQWSLADAEKGTAPKKGIAVVLGCGPVGLCAISSAKTLFETVYATDLNASRLPAAEKHGAIALPLPELKEALMKATEGRGADAVLEVVGHPSAVADALELVRPYGAVSSVGVHNAPLSVSAEKFYDKNVRMQFGRCSVRTFFPAAMNVLKGNLDLFRSFVQFKVGINEAPEYYTRFEKGEIGKTVFVM